MKGYVYACKECGDEYEGNRRRNGKAPGGGLCRRCRSIAFHDTRYAVVYSFICPDRGGVDGKGRRYIGAVTEGAKRGCRLARSNPRIAEALKTHPEKTWGYEELARLPSCCSSWDGLLHAIEQLFIEAYRTLEPEFGFNMKQAHPALASHRRQRMDILSQPRLIVSGGDSLARPPTLEII